MSYEFIKRIITSFFLLFILYLIFENSFFLTFVLIFIFTVSFYEFYSLIKIISIKFNFNKTKFFLYNLFFLAYISSFCGLLYYNLNFNTEIKNLIFYIISVCIITDIGGFVIGKTFGGRKLTILSPKKTVSGSIGGLFFSVLLTIFYWHYVESLSLSILLIISLITSISSQVGDILISYFKRTAEVKNTGKFLPGHGGLLDRIDGVLLGFLFGFFTLKLLYF